MALFHVAVPAANSPAAPLAPTRSRPAARLPGHLHASEQLRLVGGSSKGDSCASSKRDTAKASIPKGSDVSSALGRAQMHSQSMTAATTISKTKHWGRGARRRTRPEPKNFDRRERERRLTGSLPARFNSLLNATRGWTGSRKQNHCPLLNSQPSPFVPAPTANNYASRRATQRFDSVPGYKRG
jgi:hypothetical protein